MTLLVGHEATLSASIHFHQARDIYMLRRLFFGTRYRSAIVKARLKALQKYISYDNDNNGSYTSYTYLK